MEMDLKDAYAINYMFIFSNAKVIKFSVELGTKWGLKPVIQTRVTYFIYHVFCGYPVCVFVWKMKQHCYGKTELKRAQNKHHQRHFFKKYLSYELQTTEKKKTFIHYMLT